MDNTNDTSRACVAITGEDAVHFLQGILTQDITKLTADQIQFAALLSPQGKILHDMFVVDARILGDDGILLDTPALYKDVLLKRLAMYKLRAKVTIADVSTRWHITYARDGGLPDPRHSEMPRRIYVSATSPASATTLSTLEYDNTQRALGIPDSAVDFAPDSVVALDAGYDLLNAVSFTKGCYVGQEVTARMHYKHIARRGFHILDAEGAPTRLALLKFEEVEAAGGTITLGNTVYHAQLPPWMQPKLAQFHAEKQSHDAPPA